VVAAGLALRPLMPVDETRYLSAAWDMWAHGDWLVPHLNGAPYPHKPPLLFWLIDAVWAVVGVHGWAGRLVSPLFALGCLWMAWRLARLIWPDDADAARCAPLILIGFGTFAFYGSLAMFDAPLAFLSLVGVEGALRAWRGLRWGWLVAGAALGLGILMKGPVAALHILPVPLLAPLWMDGKPRGGRLRWYGFALGAFLLGAAIGLAWAIPAAEAGGPDYAAAMLWGQTADRVVRSFAHREPPWWYLPVLPGLLFPWIFVPKLWRGFRRRLDTGERLCLVWFVAPLIVFSAVSGKQAQYLLPELAPAALFFAHRLAGARGLAWIAASVAALLVIANAVFAVGFASRYDLGPAAAFLSEAERNGRTFATAPDYEGQYNFVARLIHPIDIVGGPQAAAWAMAHPRGLLLVTLDRDAIPSQWTPVATFPERDKTLVVWDAAAVIASGGKVMGARY
jgi:4-amino-4-deoxy-L-arabinose transferase-like glycosyltransferase